MISADCAAISCGDSDFSVSFICFRSAIFAGFRSGADMSMFSLEWCWRCDRPIRVSVVVKIASLNRLGLSPLWTIIFSCCDVLFVYDPSMLSCELCDTLIWLWMISVLGCSALLFRDSKVWVSLCWLNIVFWREERLELLKIRIKIRLVFFVFHGRKRRCVHLKFWIEQWNAKCRVLWDWLTSYNSLNDPSSKLSISIGLLGKKSNS